MLHSASTSTHCPALPWMQWASWASMCISPFFLCCFPVIELVSLVQDRTLHPLLRRCRRCMLPLECCLQKFLYLFQRLLREEDWQLETILFTCFMFQGTGLISNLMQDSPPPNHYPRLLWSRKAHVHNHCTVLDQLSYEIAEASTGSSAFFQLFAAHFHP